MIILLHLICSIITYYLIKWMIQKVDKEWDWGDTIINGIASLLLPISAAVFILLFVLAFYKFKTKPPKWL